MEVLGGGIFRVRMVIFNLGFRSSWVVFVVVFLLKFGYWDKNFEKKIVFFFLYFWVIKFYEGYSIVYIGGLEFVFGFNFYGNFLRIRLGEGCT